MNPTAAIERHFSGLGGLFVTPVAELGERVHMVRGFVLDWDGVFNAGDKGDVATSTFSEPDSMGTNLLRYAYWRKNGALPVTAIVTGASNPTARQFATREHFSAVYGDVLDKAAAIEELCALHGLDAGQMACVFDDVNDLPVAARCGVRFLVRRRASPLFVDYAVRHGYCDYVTGQSGGQDAVREIAELVVGLLGLFDEVVSSRVAFDEQYARYFSARQAASTALFPAR